MRKLLILIVFLGVAPSFAQAQIRPGVSLGYGTEIRTAMLGLNCDFFFNNQMSITPNLNLFFRNNAGRVNQSYTGINVDYHYYFLGGDVNVYALAGLHVGILTTSFDDTNAKSSNTSAGLNLGLGLDISTGANISPFFEFKYAATNFDQAVFQGGIKVGI